MFSVEPSLCFQLFASGNSDYCHVNDKVVPATNFASNKQLNRPVGAAVCDCVSTHRLIKLCLDGKEPAQPATCHAVYDLIKLDALSLDVIHLQVLLCNGNDMEVKGQTESVGHLLHVCVYAGR